MKIEVDFEEFIVAALAIVLVVLILSATQIQGCVEAGNKAEQHQK